MKQMTADIEDFPTFFKNGMGKTLPPIQDASTGTHINLGAGNSPVPFAANLDLPDWEAPLLAFDDGTVAAVHAYHFLEHLPTYLLLQMLREVERVLEPGGVFNVVVPYAHSDLAHQDPTHETFFTEDTWRVLFDNPYYGLKRAGESEPWRFDLGFNLIAGIAGRNLAIFTQLIKTEE